jgi:hypothetical protein
MMENFMGHSKDKGERSKLQKPRIETNQDLNPFCISFGTHVLYSPSFFLTSTPMES